MFQQGPDLRGKHFWLSPIIQMIDMMDNTAADEKRQLFGTTKLCQANTVRKGR